MAKRLAFLPEVPGEIQEASDWYAERNPEVADQFLAALERVLGLIEEHPRQGAYHDDSRLYRCRRLTRFPFVVVYREDVDRTLIVAVYHASRHPDHWKKRGQ
ncbi:MAG: type II toxin-antitoxin system RelE/ParE family toxin [Pirellulales bacterium]|nr:type II toxin-antitoxin system RelE/ParE family toxin [Pirellulales bacterium]